jgi:hypothetical protein
VSDGVVNVSTPFSITVQNKPSSGGSLDWLMLVLLTLIGIRRLRFLTKAA